MKTLHTKVSEIKRNKHILDADGAVLGRLSTQIVQYLMGKQKPDYSPHMDMGDYVLVLNASKVRLTGRKVEQKVYYSHSGYPGGFKEVSFKKMSAEHPERVIELAVRRMLPNNRLRDVRMRRLTVVADNTNPFEKNNSNK